MFQALLGTFKKHSFGCFSTLAKAPFGVRSSKRLNYLNIIARFSTKLVDKVLGWIMNYEVERNR